MELGNFKAAINFGDKNDSFGHFNNSSSDLLENQFLEHEK